jgi:type IV pilus assembly protein PilF
LFATALAKTWQWQTIIATCTWSVPKRLPMFRKLGNAVRSRPWRTLFVLGLAVVVGAGACAYGYAVYQWHTAQLDLKEGRPADARGRLDLCLVVWPGNSDVHRLAARAARMSGDFSAAEEQLKECRRLDNGATEATQLEHLLMRAQMGEEDQVAAALSNLVDNNHPESALILETMAAAYMYHLRLGEAYDCLTRWMKEEPNSAKPLHWRGWVLERLGHHVEVMDDYKKALELDPDLVPVRLRVAEMLLSDKQTLEALPHLERLRKQCPGRADVLARLGQCRFLQGQVKEARRLMETAVKDLPNDSALLLNLAQLELQEGHPTKAEGWLRRALKVDPGDTDSQYTLVTILQVLGRREEAAAALERRQKNTAVLERTNQLLKDEAKQQGSKDPGPPSEIGTLLLQIGQDQKGLYWLEQALQRDPTHEPTHRVLADYYERHGEHEKAATHRRWLTGPPGPAAAAAQPTASR